MKSAVKTVGVVGSSITHRAVNTVDSITTFIQITARRFIFFISYKIRAIVCGLSSILLLKDCLTTHSVFESYLEPLCRKGSSHIV